MNYTKIKRFNESHESTISPEILNMTIGEFLDRAGEMDTEGNVEYEVIEDAIKAMSNNFDAGYPREEGLDNVGSIESTEDEVEFTDDDSDEIDDIPTFADADTFLANEKPEDSDGLDTFNF